MAQWIGAKTLLLPDASKWDLTQPESVRQLKSILEELLRKTHSIGQVAVSSMVRRAIITTDAAGTGATSFKAKLLDQAGDPAGDELDIYILPDRQSLSFADYIWTHTPDGSHPSKDAGSDPYLECFQDKDQRWYLLRPQPIAVKGILGIFVCET